MRNIDPQYMRVETDVDLDTIRPRRVIWGVAPTGAPHIGYLPYLLFLRWCADRGADCVLLIANFHAYLDNGKTRWTDLDARTAAYRRVFESIGFSVLETREFYLTPEYLLTLLELSTYFRVTDILAAGDTTVATCSGTETAAEIIYTATQIVDVKHLNADLVLCGVDESPIYKYCLPILKQVATHDAGHCYLPMVPGLCGPEMHASDHDSNKILLGDSAHRIHTKLHDTLKTIVTPPDREHSSKGAGGRMQTPESTAGSHAGMRMPFADYCRDMLFPFAGLYEHTEALVAAAERADVDGVADVLTDGLVEAMEMCHTADLSRQVSK